MRNAYEALDEDKLDYFALDEWPDPKNLKHVDARVLFALDELRERYGQRIYPSRAAGGWARFSGSQTSKHYAVDRLCTAGDIFPAGSVLDCWMHAIQMRQWGGFGLYLDTNRNEFQPGPMMHLDLRTGPRVFWVRNEVGSYIYKSEDPVKFWKAVARVAEVDND
jgi:hypothetical protein